eukprot:TRINITY_DN21930_c0_g1_i1.p1 TRINITY_DN21930_c0_g1~~TRINITY_DN21930_c0_g1_i1.p1  ORF type:complete len:1211 (-),score=161.12 TRINITY_DN21930_c0_g1_i1:90-3329(-)
MLDNVDNRIAADTANFASFLEQFVLAGLTSLGSIYFLASNGLAGLDAAVAAFIVFAVQLGLITLVIGKTSGNIFQLESYEGSFRYAHSRLREYSECIAFYSGEISERLALEEIFGSVVGQMSRVINWQAIQQSISVLQDPLNPCNIFNLLVPFFLLCINPWRHGLTPQRARGMTHLEVLVTLVTPTAALLSNPFKILSFVTNVGSISPLAGATHRVGELLERLVKTEKAKTNELSNDGFVDDLISVSGVQLQTPDGRILISQPISFSVRAGEHLAIVGASGCGKSTLLRRISGLICRDVGTVRRPEKIGRGGIMFIPQKPYVFLGSLKSQIIYPDDESDIDEESLIQILDTVGLLSLADRRGLEQTMDWANSLSGGEQQRLSFARILYHRPKFVLMDEGTSALDIDAESTCMARSSELGCTFISIAHRLSAIAWHDRVLRLDPVSKGWTLRDAALEKERATSWRSLAPPEGSGGGGGGKADSGSDASGDSAYGLCVSICNLGRILRRGGFPEGAMKNYFYIYLLCCALMIAGSLMQIHVMGVVVYHLTRLQYQEATYFIVLNLAVSVLDSAVYAFTFFVVSRRWGLFFRRGLVARAHILYVTKKVYYELNVLNPGLDPDQRITQDVAQAAQKVATLFLGGQTEQMSTASSGLIFRLLWCIALFAYLSQWSLIFGAGVFGMRFLAILVTFWGPALVAKYYYRNRTAFADFRFLHARLRVFLESVTIYHGEAAECKRLDAALRYLIHTSRLCVLATVPIAIVTNLVEEVYSLLVRNALTVLANLPNDSVEAFFCSQSAMAYLSDVSGGLAKQLLADSGAMFSSVNRVHDLFEKLGELQHDKVEFVRRMTIELGKGPQAVSRKDSFQVHGLLLCTPRGTPLMKSLLNFSVAEGSGLVIVGPSGCGKTTLLRLLAGLLQPCQGLITSPAKETVFFMPQRPYLIEGSLYDQIAYPRTFKPDDRARCDDLLDAAGLQYLKNPYRLGPGVQSWDGVMSLGEQQRLGFARLFFQEGVKFAVMDESTSSLDVESENECLRMCQQRGITMISIAHRPSVVPFHANALRLHRTGEHDLVPVSSLMAIAPK